MLYLPPLRRLLLPSLICLAIIIAYRSSSRITDNLSSLILEQPEVTLAEERIPVADLRHTPLIVQRPDGQLIPPTKDLYYDYVDPRTPIDNPDEAQAIQADTSIWVDPSKNRHLKPLLECRKQPNPHTGHIRIAAPIRPIAMVRKNETDPEKREFLNAALFSLPYWSDNQYLLVTRVQTDGSIQLNLVCEANICYTDEEEARPGEKPCDEDDLKLLNGTEGMRCATQPMTLNVPATPANKCGNGSEIMMTDVPGFHDPRIFWSGKGEPLMMVNSQSRYMCFGLWVIDLRTLHLRLAFLLGSNPSMPTLGPLQSYPTLTEITRNPPETRGIVEKNWMFFSTRQSNYVHYDMGPSVRTFGKLIGGGLTTANLTDPLEKTCVEDGQNQDTKGSWHQGTNSLTLVLCERSDGSCRPNAKNTVFWSLIHHKHKNMYSLPLRYERYFIVWSATPPFSMLAISKHPILLANETATNWTPEENWEDDPENQRLVEEGKPGKDNWAIFTYTVSIAYAWGRENDQPHDKNIGYIDDEVILGVGIDDQAQGYARMKVLDLLQCMRTCPGRKGPEIPHSVPKNDKDGDEEEEQKEEEVVEVIIEDDNTDQDFDDKELENEGKPNEDDPDGLVEDGGYRDTKNLVTKQKEEDEKPEDDKKSSEAKDKEKVDEEIPTTEKKPEDKKQQPKAEEGVKIEEKKEQGKKEDGKKDSGNKEEEKKKSGR